MGSAMHSGLEREAGEDLYHDHNGTFLAREHDWVQLFSCGNGDPQEEDRLGTF